MLKKYFFAICIFIMWPLPFAFSDCSTLALKYSKNPNTLNIDELAELKKCVSDQLSKKFEEKITPTTAFTTVPTTIWPANTAPSRKSPWEPR